MIQLVKLYNRDDYRKISGIQSFVTDRFDDYATAERVEKYFNKKFNIHSFVTAMLTSDGYVVMIDNFDADRILSYYDKQTGFYTFGIELNK